MFIGIFIILALLGWALAIYFGFALHHLFGRHKLYRVEYKLLHNRQWHSVLVEANDPYQAYYRLCSFPGYGELRGFTLIEKVGDSEYNAVEDLNIKVRSLIVITDGNRLGETIYYSKNEDE